jgi:nucleoid-associated protein EbfC
MMLGNLGQIMSLMKNAGQIKQAVQEIGERMKAARYTADAGGGQVKATVDGKGDLIAVKFEPALVQGGDVELIEDLTCAAIRAAVATSRQAAQAEIQNVTGGLNLPGLDGLFGGMP